MRLRPATPLLLALLLAAPVLAGCLTVPQALQGQSVSSSPPATAHAAGGLAFAPAIPVDTLRAGGEPVVLVHPDGTIVLASHAGTTHLHGAPQADFVAPYTGQTYVWRSTDHGRTWNYVGLPNESWGPHGPGKGFSDPDLALDSAGNMYLAELDASTISVSQSADAGATWLYGNPAASGIPAVDRPWLAADGPNEVYLALDQLPTGHMVLRSTDGGLTFPNFTYVPGGAAKIEVDPATHAVYDVAEVHGGFDIEVSHDHGATFQNHTVVRGRHLAGIFASLALDQGSALYLAWTETGPGNGTSIWLAHSTDGGVTWSAPTMVSAGNVTAMWPWVSAGSPGRVRVAWLQADQAGNPANLPGAAWNVDVAATQNATSANATWVVSQATTEPVHRGSICESGTACEAQNGDRRLGDFFTTTLDPEGRLLIAVADTRLGGSISHPLFLTQTAGPSAYAGMGNVTNPWS